VGSMQGSSSVSVSTNASSCTDETCLKEFS
jgi:hypothetical protein